MWTSIAAKPARSNAAAISTCPLTPCSRRIAIGGRAPVAMKGAATSSAGSNVEHRRKSRVRRIEQLRVFLVDARGIVAQPLQLVRRRRPGAVKVDARFVEQQSVPQGDPDPVVGCRRADGMHREPCCDQACRDGGSLVDGAPARRRPALRQTTPRADRRTPHRARCRGRSATRTPSRKASRTARRRRRRDRRAAGLR